MPADFKVFSACLGIVEDEGVPGTMQYAQNDQNI